MNIVPRAKILVVDDSEFDRNLIQKFLEKNQFEVVPISDGAAVLESIKSLAPSLVLLDILMPRMTGGEALGKIREKYSAVQLPVLMITAKTDAADVVEFLRLGANDYITKPIHFDVTLMRVLTHLQIAELSRQMSKLKELEAVNAMITTYNHEINNPLSIALALLQKIGVKHGDQDDFASLQSALWRVADIVKKIAQVSSKEEVEYEEYVKDVKMVKVK